MKFSKSEEMLTHLEFLGYKVETTTDEDFDWLRARSETNPNLSLRVSEDLTIISSTYSPYNIKALESKEFLSCLNNANKSAVVTKWYFSEDDEQGVLDLTIESTYHEYSKISFGNLVNMHGREIIQYGQDFEPFLK